MLTPRPKYQGQSRISPDFPVGRSQGAGQSQALSGVQTLGSIGLDIAVTKQENELTKQYDMAEREVDAFITQAHIDYQGQPTEFQEKATDFINGISSGLPQKNSRTQQAETKWLGTVNRGVLRQTGIRDKIDDSDYKDSSDAKMEGILESMGEIAPDAVDGSLSQESAVDSMRQLYTDSFGDLGSRVLSDGSMVYGEDFIAGQMKSAYRYGYGEVFYNEILSEDSIEKLTAMEEAFRDGTYTHRYFSEEGFDEDIQADKVFDVGDRDKVADFAKNKIAGIESEDRERMQGAVRNVNQLASEYISSIERQRKAEVIPSAVWVVDGDTVHFTVEGSDHRYKVRLANIEALEIGQTFKEFSGADAQAALFEALRSGAVSFIQTGEDTDNNRLVGSFFVTDDKGKRTNVAAGLIQKGLVYYYNAYGDNEVLRAAAKQAASEGIGLFKYTADSSLPSQFREESEKVGYTPLEAVFPSETPEEVYKPTLEDWKGTGLPDAEAQAEFDKFESSTSLMELEASIYGWVHGRSPADVRRMQSDWELANANSPVLEIGRKIFKKEIGVAQESIASDVYTYLASIYPTFKYRMDQVNALGDSPEALPLKAELSSMAHNLGNLLADPDTYVPMAHPENVLAISEALNNSQFENGPEFGEGAYREVGWAIMAAGGPMVEGPVLNSLAKELDLPELPNLIGMPSNFDFLNPAFTESIDRVKALPVVDAKNMTVDAYLKAQTNMVMRPFEQMIGGFEGGVLDEESMRSAIYGVATGLAGKRGGSWFDEEILTDIVNKAVKDVVHSRFEVVGDKLLIPRESLGDMTPDDIASLSRLVEGNNLVQGILHDSALEGRIVPIEGSTEAQTKRVIGRTGFLQVVPKPSGEGHELALYHDQFMLSPVKVYLMKEGGINIAVPLTMALDEPAERYERNVPNPLPGESQGAYLNRIRAQQLRVKEDKQDAGLRIQQVEGLDKLEETKYEPGLTDALNSLDITELPK